MDLISFQNELKKKGVKRVINEILFDGPFVCFNNNEDTIWNLKKSISNHFEVHTQNIEIVGSARIGISLNPNHLGKDFNNSSDIDVLIISEELFNEIWNDLMMFHSFYKLSELERKRLKDALNTINRGFISPNLLPNKIGSSKKWWTIFSNLSSKKDYEYRKIRGRLFKNWFFAEKYYSKTCNNLIDQGGFEDAN